MVLWEPRWIGPAVIGLVSPLFKTWAARPLATIPPAPALPIDIPYEDCFATEDLYWIWEVFWVAE